MQRAGAHARIRACPPVRPVADGGVGGRRWWPGACTPCACPSVRTRGTRAAARGPRPATGAHDPAARGPTAGRRGMDAVRARAAVRKSPVDNREYQFVELVNGLKARAAATRPHADRRPSRRQLAHARPIGPGIDAADQ